MRLKTLPVLVLAAVMGIAAGSEKTLRFGVVTDIQYYPGASHGNRYYRASLGKLKEALSKFNGEKVEFVINLGDTIDRHLQSFDGVMPLFKKSKAPVYHLIGNHDLVDRSGDGDEVRRILQMKDSYYSFVKGRWRLIFLDGLELRYPFPADETLRRESEALYLKLCAGREELRRPWNGGISQKQIAWLEHELGEAESARENVLVLGHFPVLPEEPNNLWNDTEVVAVLEKYRCVKAYFCGHSHAGNYVIQHGIHYLTFRGMVETPDQNAFAVVTLGDSALQVQGFGREPNRSLGF